MFAVGEASLPRFPEHHAFPLSSSSSLALCARVLHEPISIEKSRDLRPNQDAQNPLPCEWETKGGLLRRVVYASLHSRLTSATLR